MNARSEALPAVLALVVPALFVISALLDGPACHAFTAAGWIVSLVLFSEVLPVEAE